MSVDETQGDTPPRRARERADELRTERRRTARRAEAPDAAERASHAREARRRAAEAVERDTDTSAEILQALARRAAAIPPEKNLLRMGAAAATLALTSLESARLVAEQIRAEIELARGRAGDSASGGLTATVRESIATTLTG